MKKELTKLAALGGLCLLMFAGCKKSGTLVTSNGGQPGALTASTTTLTLDKTKVNDVATQAIAFNFTAANYGYSAAVTNTLQIDKPGDNWANPASITLAANVLSLSYNTPDFNGLLLKLGLTGGVTTTVNVRVVQAISTSVTPAYSNVLTLTVTPFNLKSYIYAVGAFQGWNASNPDSLVSPTSNGTYTGIINFTAGNNQFLLLPKKNYDNKYATNVSGTPSTVVTYNASNNLIAPTAAGQYLVTWNSNAGSISFALANYYSVIGDAAQGWGTDVAMKYINDGSNTWSLTTPLVSTGAFKIRQNNDWGYSWGTVPAPDGVSLTSSSGGNISVSASGTYKIGFIIPVTLAGTQPQTIANYTLVKQ